MMNNTQILGGNSKNGVNHKSQNSVNVGNGFNLERGMSQQKSRGGNRNNEIVVSDEGQYRMYSNNVSPQNMIMNQSTKNNINF